MNILQTEFRIIELNRKLQCRPLRYPNNPIPSHFDEHSLWWDRFASEFFEDDATLTLRLALEEKPVEYTIGRTLIPRFFRTYFDGGVTDLSINLRNPKETCIHPHMITLDCDQAFIVTNNIFKITGMPSNHGVVVHTEGHLNIDFVSNNFDSLSIKAWRFYTRRSHEYINRAILTTLGLPNNYLAEPITRQGLTQSTISYLKMCMIMEPMQELMYHYKLTKMDPRSCLRKLLFDRYKYRSGEDTRAATNKKRKRKPSAPPSIGAATTTKRSKATMNNSIGNNTGLNNNMIMSPPAVPGNFSLASQDVMVVGEPSMMGGDFGDDNERMITRLENTQYDPSAPVSLDMENADFAANNNNLNGGNHVESNHNRIVSPSLIDQTPNRQAQQIPALSASPLTQQIASAREQSQQTQDSPSSQPPEQQQMSLEQIALSQDQTDIAPKSPRLESQLQLTSAMVQVNLEQDSDQNGIVQSGSTNQPGTIFTSAQDNHNVQRTGEPNPQEQQQPVRIEASRQRTHGQIVETQGDLVEPTAPVTTQNDGDHDVSDHRRGSLHIEQNNVQHQTIIEDVKVNSLSEGKTDPNIVIGVDLVGSSDNHNSLIQDMNDESNSNSHLPCPTADNTSALEQQQPVDNGVA